jgi:hypothetical protein
VEEAIGMVAVVMVFSIPLAAILSGPLKQWMAQRERREARQLYERLSLEKLDVIKTAVAMGTSKADLADLDDRLERLIGSDKMKQLLPSPERKQSGQDELIASMSRDEFEDIYGSKRRSRRAERS